MVPKIELSREKLPKNPQLSPIPPMQFHEWISLMISHHWIKNFFFKFMTQKKNLEKIRQKYQ